MAVIANIASGYANDPSIWTGGVVPMYPDCASLINGTTVENPVGHVWRIGDASNSTVPALRNAGTGGTGVFINKGTLQLDADMSQGNANWEFHAGSVVESSNTTSTVIWYSGDAAGQVNTRITIVGTGPGSGRVVFRKGSGSTGFYIRPANIVNPTSQLVGSWLLCENLGDGSTPGFRVGFTGAAGRIDIDQMIYTGSGVFSNISAAGLSSKCVFRHTSFVNSAHTSRSIDMSAAVSGTRTQDLLFEHCVFDKAFRFTGFHQGQTDHVIVLGLIDVSGIALRWDDVVCYDTAASGSARVLPSYSALRGIRTRINASGTNWHGYQVSHAGATDINGVIFDGANNSSVGDMIIFGSPGSATTVTVKNAIATKSPHSTGCYGKLTSQGGNANITVALKHCFSYTYASAEGGIVGFGETYAGRADMVSETKHCLAVGLAAGAGVLFSRYGGGASANIRNAVTVANIDDNVVTNCRAGGAGVGPASFTAAGGDGIMWDPTLPPAPLDEPPMFADEDRNLATWYRRFAGGSPGTREDDSNAAIAALCTMNDDSPIAWATIDNAYRWIRLGQLPRNPRLRTMSSPDNGGWVGPVEGRNVSRKRIKSLI